MRKLIYLFLAPALSACGQSADVRIMSEISSSKTAAHINIPGTRLYIIPPSGFTVATTFIGLQKGEYAMVNVYDLNGGNFYSNAATFSKAAFEQKGLKVFDYKEIKVNGYPAKYISMQGDPATKSYGLVFGDTTFSTLIMAVCPTTDDITAKQIIRSLNTIWYDKGKKVDPFATARFSLDDKVSRFKFSQYAANMYIYSIDGIQDKNNKDAPGLFATQFPTDKTTSVKGVADMMIGKMEESGLTNAQVKNSSTQSINGYETYEAEIYGQLQDKKSLVYFCIVSKDDITIVIQGVARDNMEEDLAEFKRLTRTVNIK